MASTQIADIFTPNAFARNIAISQIELNAFLASGVARADPVLSERFSGGSLEIDLPRLQGVTIKEPNYSTDDPAVNSTPDKIGTLTQKARSASRNQSWSAMDLARELTDADPVGAITGSIGGFWATDDEARLIKSALGILADNVANDSGDMLVDVSDDVATAVLAAERIGGDTIISAAQTMGDHKSKVNTIAVHSIQHSRLQRLGLVVDNFDPETGTLRYQTYLGYRIIMDDSLPLNVGTNRTDYTTILFADGAFGFATGKVQTPAETERVASAGNGGGETILHSRINTCFHPYGFKFLSASVAGQSPTYAELALAANWDRVLARKLIPIAFLKVND